MSIGFPINGLGTSQRSKRSRIVKKYTIPKQNPMACQMNIQAFEQNHND